jgi:hypothetical protein
MARRREELPDRVKEVAARIERWRRKRQKGSRMPEELWSEAVSLARAHGVYQISRALQVRYESLRKRVERGEQEGEGGARCGDFVEVDMSRLAGASEPVPTVVELSRADGAKVVVRLSPGQGVDVLGLADTLWRRRG